MGILKEMSRNHVIHNVILAAFLCAATPVVAQETPQVKDELAYRAALGRADDIKLLLSQKKDPNSLSEQGIPVLMLAASRKDVEAINAVQALLEGGANVNIKDKNGQTALFYAARSGKTDVVDYLLRNKIDYYALDNNGDIARTIAYRAGYKDMVQLMDNYVKNQTLQMNDSYRAATSMDAAQQERERLEAEQQTAEEQRKLAEEEARIKEEEERALAEYNENVKKLPGMIYDISYNACAFQYWSFVWAAEQTITLSSEQLAETIDNHRQSVRDVGFEVMKMFNATQSYVAGITEPSKQRVYNQLNQMPSRTYRKQNGVGTAEDVHKRCENIARSWELGTSPAAPKPAAPAPAAAPPAPKSSAKPLYPGHIQTFKPNTAPSGAPPNN